MATNDELKNELSKEAEACLRYGVEKIEHCLAQLNDQQIWWRPKEEMNAIGNLMLHLSGNLSQWIISGIGESEDSRDRAGEFSERRVISKDDLIQKLRGTVEQACATILEVAPDDLLVIKRIQGSQVSKMHAMLHSITHFQGHVQEIIGLTRQQLGKRYQFQWIPRTAEEGA